MTDLKAAAKRLRESAKRRIGEIQFFAGMEQSEKRIAAEADDYILAAQALEAWAWQQETGAGVRRKFTGTCWKWACYASGGRSYFEYVADTPLGALRRAKEASDGRA